eukprot:TRINITY_DN5692_c0_g1_i2.p1 TRINITY_DN5692_c0_g1~~TRINITY_DN5692_c0_g1_i2.p1  ORF type:complete len:135 (+),score=34.47 TRINITY_DN5692_c0_g1_i2:756-1160(+)
MPLQNLEFGYQMYLAFSDPKIEALYQSSHKAIKDSRKQVWEDTKLFFQVEKGSPFLQCRPIIRTSNPPILPPLEMYLQDLEMVNASQPDQLENGFVNFEKCKEEAKIVQEIAYLKSGYSFPLVEDIREWLENNV